MAKKGLIKALILGGIFALALAFAPACNSKAATATLTLDAGNGGSISMSEYQVQVETSLSEFVKDIAPVPESGLTFAGWYTPEGPLADDVMMPSSGYALKAKYYAQYTADLYLEDENGNYGEAQPRTGTAIYGEPFTYAPSMEYFTVDEGHEGSRLTTQSLGKAEKFTAYLARERFYVNYSANAPQGVSSTPIAATDCIYGGEAVLKDGKLFNLPQNYRFAGWSKLADGEVEYSAGQAVAFTEDITLYAQWEVAYTDRFGGNDLIFVSSAGDNVVYLRRGGYDFKGTIAEDIFTFELPNKQTLKGKLYSSSFAYLRGDIQGEYTLSRQGTLIAGSKLTIDEFWNATYANGARTTTGRVSYNNNVGDWSFLLDDDRQEFRFRPVQSADKPYFEMGGDEAGEYIGIVYADEEGDALNSTGDIMLLNGYGKVTRTDDGGNVTEGEYTVSAVTQMGEFNIYTVLATVGREDYYFYTLPLEGGLYGCLYADATKATYTGPENSTLVLDGFGIFAASAVYTSGSVRYSGVYSVKTYSTAGKVVTLTTLNNQEFKFLLNGDAFTLLSGDGARLPVYELSRVRYSDGVYGQIDPLLVLYDYTSSKGFFAELYVGRDDGGYDLAATGTYEEERLNYNLYLSTFTLTQKIGSYDAPQSFKYIVGGMEFENRSVEVYYVLEWNGEKQYIEYTQKDGAGKIYALPLPMGCLYFAPDGKVFQGTFSDMVEHTDLDGMRTFKFTYIDYSTMEFTTIDCEVTGGNNYAVLENAPITLFHTDSSGVTEIFASLKLDGKGAALYMADENSESVKGTYKKSGTTVFGDAVYSLTAGNTQFEFILGTYYDYYTDSVYDVYYIYDPSLDGTYKSADGGSLILDGYCYALYTAGDGTEQFGTYFYADDGVALSFFGDLYGEYYFLVEGQKFTVLGAEYGVWDLADNNYAEYGCKVTFDGLKKVTFTYGEKTVEGEYTVTGAYQGLPELAIKADFGDGTKTFSVSFVKILSGENYCVVSDADVYGAYISDDWSVLTLDGHGYGYYYSADGSISSRVICTLFDASKGHLKLQLSVDYQINYLVTLNTKDGTFILNNYSEYVYYSDNFSGVRFGANGYAYVLNEVGWYFIDGDVSTVYVLADGNSYTSLTLFAPGEDSVQYKGQNFKLWNGSQFEISGTIEFRDENGALMQDYPSRQATLKFTPDGNVRFSAEATVIEGGREYAGFTFNAGYSYGGAPVTQITYGGVSYNVEITSQNGVTAFKVNGGKNVEVFNDQENTINSYGSLTYSSFGFGPIEHTDPTIRGSLNYTRGSDVYAFNFTVSAQNVLTVGYDSDYGDRYALIFSDGEKQYVINYYLSGGGYYLYSLAEYSEVSIPSEETTYKLGICKHVYDSGNFTLLSTTNGEVCGLILYKNGDVLKEYKLEKAGPTYLFTAATQSGSRGTMYVIRITANGGATVTEVIE